MVNKLIIIILKFLKLHKLITMDNHLKLNKIIIMDNKYNINKITIQMDSKCRLNKIL